MQISRSLVKNLVLMESSGKTVSQRAMEAEWEEIQAAQRQPALFKPLYNRYYEAIFRFIYRRTNDEHLSGDLVAQVFLKAMQKLNKYQFKGVPFSAWLYRIASNQVAQHFRDAKKDRTVSIEDQNLTDLAEEMEAIDNEQLRTLLIKSLEDLKPIDLSLIELRFFEQRPFKEIANLLEITESNAKVKTYRILEKLKKNITKNM